MRVIMVVSCDNSSDGLEEATLTKSDYERLQSYIEFADNSLDKALDAKDEVIKDGQIRSAKTELKNTKDLLERVRTLKANRR